jgi:hypothetical protein
MATERIVIWVIDPDSCMDGIAVAEACDIVVSADVGEVAAWCAGRELLHAASPSEITASEIRSVRIAPTL